MDPEEQQNESRRQLPGTSWAIYGTSYILMPGTGNQSSWRSQIGSQNVNDNVRILIVLQQLINMLKKVIKINVF